MAWLIGSVLAKNIEKDIVNFEVIKNTICVEEDVKKEDNYIDSTIYQEETSTP